MLVGTALPPTAAAQLSSGASLESLSVVSDVAQTKMTPAFDPEVTDYLSLRVYVGSGVVEGP